MKQPSRLVVAGPLFAATLALGTFSSACRSRAVPPATQVACEGTACGGSGGSLGSAYAYRIQPRGNSITSFDVSVEDGHIDHYAYRGPDDWDMSILSLPRAHDLAPTGHGFVSSEAGECPYVLRFSGPARTQEFEVGFDYVQPNARFHDAHWMTSGGDQSAWDLSAGSNDGPVHSPLRLNVLLIVLDDVGTDKLQLFDTPHPPAHAFARTPNLEQLAVDGVWFTNYYVNPLCSTTRACIQTGRYAFRHGIGSLPFRTILADCEVTLAELLKQGFASPQAAYRSGAFGKWHLTPDRYEPANLTHAVRNGYDRFSGTLANCLDHFDWTKVEHDAERGEAEVIEITDRWSADVVREDAASWIAETDEPFFAYVAFNPPHGRFDPPPFETADGRSLLSPETRAAIEATIADDKELSYRAMIEAVDAEIRYLLDDIGPAKVAKTMVLVASDNGAPDFLIREPHPIRSNYGKASVYQLGVRVPMIVSGPLAAPGVCSAAVGAVDLWSTIAEITGADPTLAGPDACDDPVRDGVSFLPLIENPAGQAPRPAFSQAFSPNGIVDSGRIDCLEQHGRAVTDGSYKYVRRLLPPDGTSSCRPCAVPCPYVHEFYDLIADPDELTSLVPPPPELQGIYDSLSMYMDSLSEF